MAELRDNIKQNWTNAGQEVGRELRQIWLQTAGHVPLSLSRPHSPAPGSMRSERAGGSYLDLPRSPPNGPSASAQSKDFEAGYSLGLIGGVRQWVSFHEYQTTAFRTL